MPRCPHCGAEVGERDFFCWSCNKRVPTVGQWSVSEEDAYAEFASAMRREYVQDRRTCALTLAALAALFVALGLGAALARPARFAFWVGGSLLVAALLGFRAAVNARLYRAAKARLAASGTGGAAALSPRSRGPND